MITYEKMRDRLSTAQIRMDEISNQLLTGSADDAAYDEALKEVSYCLGAMDALCDNGLCPKDNEE